VREPELSGLERELLVAAVAAARLARALTIANAVLRKSRDFNTVRVMENVSSGETERNSQAQPGLPFPKQEDPFE